MKQKKRWFSLVGICLIFAFASCSEEDKSVFGDDFEIPELTDANTIQFTVDATGDWKSLEILVGGGPVAIEWGDGRLQKIAKADGLINYRYRNNTINRVRIWAEELELCSVGSILLPVSDLRIGVLPNMKRLYLNSFMNTKELNLSADCPNLEEVQIGNLPDLTYLSINGCTDLKTISIYTVPKLTFLDEFVSEPNLTTFTYSSDGLTSLSLKGCPNLRVLNCYNSSDLSALEVEEGNKINTLEIINCAFSTTEFLSRMPHLQRLDCSMNKLVNLDLSGQKGLMSLDCSKNLLENVSLPVDNGLHMIYCHSNHLSASALNRIFELLNTYPILPATNGPKLSFYDNQGAEERCDKTVFQQKHWYEIQKGIYSR